MKHEAEVSDTELAGAGEVVAVFQSNDALVNAVDALELHGVDRARLTCLPAGSKEQDEALRAAGFKSVRDLLDAPGVPRTAFMDPGDIAAAKGAVISGLVFVAATLSVAVASAAIGPIIAPMVASAVAGGSAGGALGAFLDHRFGGHYARYVRESLEHGGLVLSCGYARAEGEQEIVNPMKRRAAARCERRTSPATRSDDHVLTVLPQDA